VLVTGAAKRLGREIALHLAAHGWQVAVHYRGSADEAGQTVADCATHGTRAAAFQADLADESATRGLVQAVIGTFGSLDALVNSASVFEHDTPADVDSGKLLRHFTTNTAAPVVLTQELHRHLAQREGRGAVVNLLDQKLWNPNPDFFSYTLSKAALETATTLLAQGLAPRLRVVGVAPGLTLTSTYLDPAKFEQLHQLSPLGRSSTPEDVAATVRFALENASITGTTLLVDGGQHLVRFARDFSFM
jgi:NAD(P)-dependent dehydrogenase (short-subunit alcohol dehydrogenase family)